MADPDPESEATEEADAVQAAAEAAEASEEATELAEVGDAAAAASDEEAWVEAQMGDDLDTVNDQVVDTLAVVEASSQSPPLTKASLEQINAQAVGLALLNAVNAQQSAYVTANSTVLAAVTRILAHGRGASSAADSRDAQGAKSSG
jgi:hypothetical protein